MTQEQREERERTLEREVTAYWRRIGDLSATWLPYLATDQLDELAKNIAQEYHRRADAAQSKSDPKRRRVGAGLPL